MLSNGWIYTWSGMQEVGLDVELGIVDIKRATDTVGVNEIIKGGKQEIEKVLEPLE